MRRGICVVLLSVVCFGLTQQAVSQDEPSPRPIPPRKHAPATPRRPFTAVSKITRVSPQADGTTITQESTKVIARDSQNRVMTSITTIPLSDCEASISHVSVLDRDAHTMSRWSVPGDQVTVMNLPEKGSGNSLCAATLVLGERLEVVPMPKAQHGRPVSRSLGTETIQGVEARGERTVITYPAGAIGNSEPLDRTTELWLATDLGMSLIVRLVVGDPLSGKLTSELQDLDLNEPNPRVFEPPPEYRVVHQDYPKFPAVDTHSGKAPAPNPGQ